MKNYLLILSLFLSLSFAFSQTGVIVYEDVDFSGFSKEIPDVWQANGVWSYFDGKISSVKIPEGELVILYERENFNGAHKLITSKWTATGEDSIWNDEVSSIKVVDPSEPFSLVFKCFIKREDQWQRTDDITISSDGKMYHGISEIVERSVDSTGAIIQFEPHATILYGAYCKFEGNNVTGWFKTSGGQQVQMYGSIYDIRINTKPPTVPQQKLDDKPASAIKAEQEQKKKQQQPIIHVGQFVPTGYVTCYKTDNYTGESMILDESWDGMDKSNWYDNIKSLKVSPGWTIRIYSHVNFIGSYRDITENWSVLDDKEWHGDVGSVKIIRKATINQVGWSSGYVTVYKNADYTGESMILDESWDGHDNDNWYDVIKSVRMSDGWAIRVYSHPDYIGYYRDITGEWSIEDDEEWNGEIGSIQVIRKPQFGTK